MNEKTGLVAAVVAVVAIGALVVTNEPVTVQVVSQDGETRVVERTGAIPGGEVYNEVAFLAGMREVDKVTSIAPTNIYSTTTLQLADSGTTYMLSASGTTITLPAVTHTGATFRFMTSGSIDTGNFVIDSAEGDNIEGVLTVTGADVSCSGEDQIDVVSSAEATGDNFEIISTGSNWLIVDSNADTTGGFTCTDPS